MNWKTCDHCGAHKGHVIRTNGSGYCSMACVHQAEAADKALRREARARMEAARDARGQISIAASCGLLALLMCYVVVSSLQAQDGQYRQWQGPRLVARMEGSR
ncbi:hypothetical protein UFOVP349_32 [uncultured Caudovirales phage]|uniref:Uncharacterized protein n=1 Tax=uncultured Caudovirales phage TaxID=2100421 RepID=A0A6J5LXM2_9CAUD|nr:hypothetical protein UFOVP349_32 [uncultured Caudovirales phage]